TVLYRAFLRRDPEEAGLDAWEAILRQTLLAVINTGFVPSAEFQGLVPEVCGTPTLTLTSLSSMAASPLEVVRMTGSGFEPAGKMVVRFSDTTGLSIDVIPVHVTSGTVSVAVPPVPDAASGAFGGRRTVNVEVVRDIGGVSVVSNVVTGFQIGPLPTTRAQAGVVTAGL